MNTATTNARIVLTLDASPACRSALEAAAELAEALHAELEGLFVEDAELIALARHPSTRELDLLTGRLRVPSAPELERRMRVQAERVRAMLSGVATTRGLAWSFRIERGALVERLREAARNADLVTISRSVWCGPLGDLTETIRGLLAASSKRLLVNGEARRGAPIVVAEDLSGAEGHDLLLLAARLATHRRVPLEVLVFSEATADATRLETAIVQQLPEPVRLHRLPAEGIEPWVESHACGLLLLPRPRSEALSQIAALVQRLRCPVLVGDAAPSS